MIPIIADRPDHKLLEEYRVPVSDNVIAYEAKKFARAANLMARARELTHEEYTYNMPDLGECEIMDIIVETTGCGCNHCPANCNEIFRNYAIKNHVYDETGNLADTDTFYLYSQRYISTRSVVGNTMMNKLIECAFATSIKMARRISDRGFRINTLSEIFDLADEAGVEL